jgi:hypothetical protein
VVSGVAKMLTMFIVCRFLVYFAVGAQSGWGDCLLTHAKRLSMILVYFSLLEHYFKNVSETDFEQL